MTPFRKKKPRAKVSIRTEPTSDGTFKKKQVTVVSTYESNGVELEITTNQDDPEDPVVTGARLRMTQGAELTYVDPGKLNDLAIVLQEAGYPK